MQQPDQQMQAQPNQPTQQQGMAQMQPAPAATQNSFCGNRPLCYDANDFAVTVTEFRSSTDGRGSKILDAMLHFVNKTNQPISLGYVDQTGGAIDDMGNRYILNTFGGGVRGMGIVAGNNMDPKFTLPAGGGGDARLEFWWAPYGKLAGVNYEVEFSIREMNRVEGNQWTLGDEALIHYQGLANGMGVAPASGGNSFASGPGGGGVSSMGSAIGGFAPGQQNASGQVAQTTYVATGQPCPPGTIASSSKATNVANAVGQQNQTANNAISNASSAISSLGSMFGKKKAQAASTTNAAGTTPCIATTNAATNPSASPAPNPALMRTTAGATVPANAANVNAMQSRSANGTMPAAAIQRTAATPTARPATTAVKPATAQPPQKTVTNAVLKQPAAATNTAKSSAKTPPKAQPDATTNNAQGR